MPRYQLQRTQLIPAARSAVFEFFSAARNLERITPPFLGFRVLTPEPIEMRAGALIEYRIALHGIPMRWLTQISEFLPEERFVDLQLRGPYRYWRHVHEFREVPGGTEMQDTVDYELPFGPIGALAHVAVVRSTVRRIFEYRSRIISSIFPEGGKPSRAG